jgi:hypothetical protein
VTASGLEIAARETANAVDDRHADFIESAATDLAAALDELDRVSPLT